MYGPRLTTSDRGNILPSHGYMMVNERLACRRKRERIENACFMYNTACNVTDLYDDNITHNVFFYKYMTSSGTPMFYNIIRTDILEPQIITSRSADDISAPCLALTTGTHIGIAHHNGGGGRRGRDSRGCPRNGRKIDAFT